MDRYLDIRILPDPEFPVHQLMEALFAKLHRCLAALKTEDIGISFPDVRAPQPGLGRLLRLHGREEAFDRLMKEEWLTGMRDHIRINAVEPVPADAGHCRVRRVQAKSNPERVRRRQMRRHGWTEAEARERVPDTAARMLDLPFLNVHSATTGRRFRLFLRHEEAPGPSGGPFNSYGLSTTATVPWF